MIFNISNMDRQLVHNVHVIIGNSALVKCEIPSFVADFVNVISWTDNQGTEFFPSDQSMGINLQLKGVLTHKQCCCLIDTLSFSSPPIFQLFPKITLHASMKLM